MASARDDIKATIEERISLLGGLGRLSCRGKSVFIKPNFNSADPFPGSTDWGFLSAAIELFRDAGAKMVLGESSGGMWRPMRRTLGRRAQFNQWSN